MIPIIAAFQFLTIIPTIVRRPFTSEEMGRAVGWFPLVGLGLGTLFYGIHYAATLILPATIAAALTLFAWVFFTRAFHLDGLMDTCDGLYGGFTFERRLEIMRDSRMGAFGVAAGILILLVKYTALASSLNPGLALVMATLLGRWTSPLVIVAFPYAREKGVGYDMKKNARLPQLLLATTITVIAAWLLSGTQGLLLILITALAAIGISLYIMRLLPGLTGDNYGTITEVTETLVLLAFATQVTF
jgi:adenosylcobinamide-GDP ribazoletransferase